jgi:uncharacterized protein (TIGR03083 family)
MEFTRHCTEIVTQTELLATDLKAADLRAPVPSCPGWSLGDLVRHIGGGHRWAEEVVRTRATEWLPDDQIRQVSGDDTGELPGDWLVEGATRLAETLRTAGGDTPIWAPFDYDRMTFWARRFAHETLVHRADATLAAGTGFAAAPDVVVDAMDEWMELDVIPAHFELTPTKRELLGPGRTLAFVATDTDADAAWFVDLTGDVITWRRGPRAAAVTVWADLTELLLLIYRRRPVTGPALEVTGDRGLLEFWLGHVAFG